MDRRGDGTTSLGELLHMYVGVVLGIGRIGFTVVLLEKYGHGIGRWWVVWRQGMEQGIGVLFRCFQLLF